MAITQRKVSWILDADIRGFFDNLSHEWLLRFLEHRVGGPRMLRLVAKWLRAGVSEDGQWSKTTQGTPQGAVISPFLANVYLPAGEEFALKHGNVSMDPAEAKAAGFTEIPFYAMEKLKTRADEVIAAMDAATGKTLWRAVLPLRAPNIQHHKDRGGCRTPAVVGPVLVCLGYEAGLFGFEAATGRPLWETKAGRGKNPALIAAGDVVVAPAPAGSWAGFDAATGKQLWQLPGSPSTGTLPVWTHGDRHFVIALSSDKAGAVTMTCVEARSGTAAWSMPLPLHLLPGSYFPCAVTVHGDTLIAFESAGAPAAGGAKAGADEDEGGGAAGSHQISAYTLTPGGAQKRWSAPFQTHRDSQPLVLHGRYVAAFVEREATDAQPHRVFDLATGQVVGSATGPGPGNGGYVQAMEDLLLVRHDGTHGFISVTPYRVGSDGSLRMGAPDRWSPPIGGHSTSYHHPVMYPVVDGRIVLRQLDGIYCWDLRRR